MNLEQTIAELEKQAQQYLDAANTLRALQSNGSSGSSTPDQAPAAADAPAETKPKKASSGKRAGAKAAKTAGQKRYVSPETRAKIAAAIKARHAARKAESA